MNILITLFISYFIASLSLATSAIPVFVIATVSFFFIVALTAPNLQKKTILFMIALFPLFPIHAGFDLLPGLIPAFKSQRIITSAMLLLWLFKKPKLGELFRTFPFTKLFLSLVFLMIVLAFIPSVKFSQLLKAGMFFLEFYFFGLMVFDLVRTEDDIKLLMKIIAIPAVVVALIGIIEYFSRVNIYALIKPFRKSMAYAVTQQVRDEGYVRIRGSFDHAISFGIYLTLSSVAVFYTLFTNRLTVFKRFFYWGTFVVMSFAVFLTRSRSALIFYALVVGVLLFFRKAGVFWLGILMGLAFIIQPYWFQSEKESVITMVTSAISPLHTGTKEMIGSAEARIQQAEIVSQIILQRPFWGEPGMFLGGSLDNYYLYFAFQFGLIATALYFLFYILQMRSAALLRLRGRSFEAKLLGEMLVLVFMGLLVVWVVVSLESYMFLVWIYIAVLARMYRNELLKESYAQKS